jgi:NADH-quinone oxidoreductase subunit J
MSRLFLWIAAHQAFSLTLLLGFIALYLLLPREQRFLRPLGMLCGIAALAVLGSTLQFPGWTADAVLFYVFSATAILAAVSTVTHHNPIYSALSFALVTLSVCGLFLLRNAQFLAAATVIIYAGAIVVTFLFIIMLAQQSGQAVYDRRAREPFLATLAAFVLLGGLLFAIDDWVVRRATGLPDQGLGARLALISASDVGRRSAAGFIPVPKGVAMHPNSEFPHDGSSALTGLGRSLFTDYLVAIELAGTLLLVAGVGAVAIASRRAPRSRPDGA